MILRNRPVLTVFSRQTSAGLDYASRRMTPAGFLVVTPGPKAANTREGGRPTEERGTRAAVVCEETEVGGGTESL